jgi:hypothetical protein
MPTTTNVVGRDANAAGRAPKDIGDLLRQLTAMNRDRTLFALRCFPAMLLASAAMPVLAQEAATDASPSGDAPAPEPAPVTSPESRQSYTPADLARYAPRNAIDMLRNIPGFALRLDESDNRGLGQATDNVIVNGQRLPGKSNAYEQLTRIPVSSVVRIEIVDGASLSLPGLSGQVANVVTKPDAFSGQYEWTPEFRPHYSHPGYTGAQVSIKGALTPKLEYTLAVGNEANRGAFGGPYRILDGTGAVTENRTGRLWSDYDSPSISGSLAWNAPGNAQGNLKATVRNKYSTYDETEDRVPVSGTAKLRDLYGQAHSTAYELSADYAFPLAEGRLKLIGVDNFRHRESSDQVLTQFADGSPTSGGRFDQLSTNGEVIGRAEFGWKWGQADWQIAAEAAFNRLDLDSGLFDYDAPTADFIEQPFPEGDGGVREKRYEAILSYGRPLSSKLNLQLSAGAEQSTISQTGPGGLSRSFFRPKGSLLLAYTPQKGTDLSLKIERVVGQLDFFDFLASVSLDRNNQNSSNANLVPQQSWNVDVEGKQDLGDWGTTDLRLFYRRTEDFVALVPLDGGGEGTGNIPLVNRFGFEWTSTFKLDPLGFKGAKLDANLILQKSSLDDPLTGIPRQMDFLTTRRVELELRHDVPGTDWAWGGSVEHSKVTPYYRLGEVGHDYEGPWFDSLFVENKNVFGLTVKAQVINLLNARHRLYRTVYDGVRTTDPILFIEDRDQLIGPIIRFSIKGSF